MTKEGEITHVLFVDSSPESKAAAGLCKQSIKKGLKIIENAAPGLHPPRLVAPEGRFISLDEVRKYTSGETPQL